MNYAILWNAIKDYPQLTPGVIAAAMNKADQNVPRESITGDELLEQTDLGELVAFDDKRTAAYWGLAGKDSISVVSGSNTRAILAALFPAGSTTRDNLVALITTPLLKSRAEILGLGRVKAGHVQKARAMFGGE